MGALEPGHGMPVAEDQDNISYDVAKLMNPVNKYCSKRRFGVSWLAETCLSHAYTPLIVILGVTVSCSPTSLAPVSRPSSPFYCNHLAPISAAIESQSCSASTLVCD